MSQEQTQEPINWLIPQEVFIHVDGYDYQVVYQKQKTDTFQISHMQFYHYPNGARADTPTPLTETGYRSAFVHCETIEQYADVKTAAIAFVKATQDVSKIKSLAQFSLF